MLIACSVLLLRLPVSFHEAIISIFHSIHFYDSFTYCRSIQLGHSDCFLAWFDNIIQLYDLKYPSVIWFLNIILLWMYWSYCSTCWNLKKYRILMKLISIFEDTSNEINFVIWSRMPGTLGWHSWFVVPACQKSSICFIINDRRLKFRPSSNDHNAQRVRTKWRIVVDLISPEIFLTWLIYGLSKCTIFRSGNVL